VTDTFKIECDTRHFHVGQVMWLYNSIGQKCGTGIVVATDAYRVTLKLAPWYTTLRLWLRDLFREVWAEYQIWKVKKGWGL